jgi:hypothetical protein
VVRLDKLKAAIRELKGNPKISFTLRGKTYVAIIQKTDFLGELDMNHEKGAETELKLEDGYIQLDVK